MAAKRINREINIELGAVVFTFKQADGSFANPLTCDVASHVPGFEKFPDHVKHLILHGANAKFGDSAASDDNEADSRESIESTYKSWTEGNWSSRSGSGGGGRIGDLVTALHTVLTASGKQVTVEEVSKRVGDADKTQKG